MPPKVGFVSLGCPKALTDSELILTRLNAEGYQTSKTFQDADLVIVNTCALYTLLPNRMVLVFVQNEVTSEYFKTFVVSFKIW